MKMLPCLSILQPWAWAIVRPDLVGEQVRADALAAGLLKDIENRTWPTPFRGRILVHAGKALTFKAHREFTTMFADQFGIALPAYEDLQRGGIVGSVTIADCVREHPSRWKQDDCYGFVLRDARPRPFVPYRGQLGIFNVPASTIETTPEGST
jgi:hypothetical protein